MSKPRLCKGGCGAELRGVSSRCPRCTTTKLTRNMPVRKARSTKRRTAEPRNNAHLDWIRAKPCCVPGCQEKAEAAHVRVQSGGGMGMKPPDRYAAPACHRHHLEQHQIGHAAFDAKYSIDMRAIAIRYADASPFIENTGDPS